MLFTPGLLTNQIADFCCIRNNTFYMCIKLLLHKKISVCNNMDEGNVEKSNKNVKLKTSKNEFNQKRISLNKFK